MSSTDTLSKAARSVWAKSARDAETKIVIGSLPLYQHLDDAGSVALRLWDEWLPDLVKDAISSRLPAKHEDGRKLLSWLAGVHDVGKATPAFAIQVPTLANQMTDAGLTMARELPDRSELRHETAGHVALNLWLNERRGWTNEQSDPFGVVVGGHHGVPPEERDLLNAPNRPHLMGTGLWVDVRNELFDWAAERFEVADRIEHWRPEQLPPTSQALVTAVVIVADWLASNDELFPYETCQDQAERVRRAWADLALPAPWCAVDGDPLAQFAERFGMPATASPRPLQVDATMLARTMPRPGLLIIEAPMGEGKTEAALLAAEVFAARSGAGGCFIALPTQATSNAMLDRLLRWLDNLPDRNGAAERSVALAHGKAGLNETYGELVSRGYFRNVGDDAVKRQGKPDAIVHRWLTGRKKRNLAFFVVGTIDQLLFGALKSRHVALRHLAMVGKVVILDEVHAYDVYMSRYLDRVLEWLGAYGVPTILLSATLPADRRADMVTAYQTGARAMTGRRRTRRELAAPLTNDHLRADIGYPVLIATSGTDDAGVHPVAPSSRQVQIQLSRMSDDLDELANTLRTELAEGGCAVVIRNTVGRVQEAARYLAGNLAEVTIIVAHSRYLAIERAAIERRLLALFGPTGSAQRQQHRYVVIASQVVEQSLDLDFDLMVTDLAPVDLMLQRIGRLHRHERGTGQAGRAPRLRSARCLVTGVDWSTEPPNPVDGSRRVYQRYPLYRSLAALTAQLNDGQPVSLPADIGPLVQRAYDDAPLGPASWQSAMAAAAVTFKASEQRRRASAETFRLGPVGAPGNSLVDWLHAGVGEAADDPVDERVGSAQVRDGTGSLEVIVIQQDVDGQYTTPHWLGRDGGRRIPTNEQVDRRLARTVASCTLPLPPAMCVPKVIDQVITELELTQFPGWQETYSLVGQLVLVLDQQRRATVAGFTLSYDPLYGLEHHRD